MPTPKLRVTNRTTSTQSIKIQMKYSSAGTAPGLTELVNPDGREVPFVRSGTIDRAYINSDINLEMVKSVAPGGGGLNQFEIIIKRGADTISVVATETDNQ